MDTGPGTREMKVSQCYHHHFLCARHSLDVVHYYLMSSSQWLVSQLQLRKHRPIGIRLSVRGDIVTKMGLESRSARLQSCWTFSR